MTAVLHAPLSEAQLESLTAMEQRPDAPIPFVPVAKLAPVGEGSAFARPFGDLVLDADARIGEIDDAADAYARAMAYEQELEDLRPLIKEAAIIRIMQVRKIASTPAEKIVETDAEYMEHRRKQRDAIIDRIRKHGQFESAKRSADLEVALVQSFTRDVRAVSLAESLSYGVRCVGCGQWETMCTCPEKAQS